MKVTLKIILTLTFLICIQSICFSQCNKSRKYIRKSNRLFKKNKNTKGTLKLKKCIALLSNCKECHFKLISRQEELNYKSDVILATIENSILQFPNDSLLFRKKVQTLYKIYHEEIGIDNLETAFQILNILEFHLRGSEEEKCKVMDEKFKVNEVMYMSALTRKDKLIICEKILTIPTTCANSNKWRKFALLNYYKNVLLNLDDLDELDTLYHYKGELNKALGLDYSEIPESISYRSQLKYHLAVVDYKTSQFESSLSILRQLLKQKFNTKNIQYLICLNLHYLISESINDQDYIEADRYMNLSKNECDNYDKVRHLEIRLKLAQEVINSGKSLEDINFAISILSNIDITYREYKQLVKLINKSYLSIAKKLINDYESVKEINLGLSYLNQIQYENGRNSKIKDLRKVGYLKIANILIDKKRFKNALHYLNSILIDFPYDKEVLKIKAGISYEIGADYRSKRNFELSNEFLKSINASSKFYTKANYLIALNYDEGLLVELSQKYITKALIYDNNNLSSYEKLDARYRDWKYSSVKGEVNKAKSIMVSFCDSNYKNLRTRAIKDNGFYNLNDDSDFQNWISGGGIRRVKFSNFSAMLNQSYDEGDISKGPDVYLIVTLDGDRNKKRFQTVWGNYQPSWHGDYFINEFPEYNFNSTLKVQMWDNDGIVKGDKIETFYFNVNGCESNYSQTSYGTSLSFNYKTTYEAPTDGVVIVYYQRSALQVVYEFTFCVIKTILKPYPFLLLSIAESVLIHKSVERTEEGIESAIQKYLVKRYAPEQTKGIIKALGLAGCFLELINELDNAGWVNKRNK